MTRLDIHPEHLMDRVLSGKAREQERSELALHLQHCAGCSAEWQLAQALRESQRPAATAMTPLVNGALEALMREGRFAQEHTEPARANALPKARIWLPWAAAACLLFTGSAAAATMILVLRAERTQVEPDKAPRTRHVTSPPVPAAIPNDEEPPKAAPIDEVPIFEIEPALEMEPAPEMSHGARRPSARRHAASRTPNAESASSLFADARSATNRGDPSEAARLYKRLQTQFPKSSETQVSRVTLGRLYLERLAEPQAALVQFDRYLAHGGSNAPEALLGRARALRSLGRVPDEAQALRLLVERYPDSLYVTSAKQRLRSLE